MRLFSWLGRHNSRVPIARRTRRRLSLLTLENRDVPAAWYTVHLNSPPQGTLGESAAHILSGGLTVDSSYDPDGDGTALVCADSGSEAIRLALTGAVTVDLSVVNLPQTEYAFSLGTSSLLAADHKSYLLAKLPTSPPPPDPDPTPGTMTFATTPGDPDAGMWRINLEDLAAHPGVSDWDYNDFYWGVTVGDGSEQAASMPIVGAQLSASHLEMTDPNAPFSVSGALVRSGVSVAQPLTVRYQLTTEEGIGGSTVVDLGTFTVTFAAGQSQVEVAVNVPPSATPSPNGRSVILTVLPPLLGTPTPYVPDPETAQVRCRAEPPKPVAARKLIMLLGFWPETDIGVSDRKGMLHQWRNRTQIAGTNYDVQAFSPAFDQAPVASGDWKAGRDLTAAEKQAEPNSGRGAYKVNYLSVKNFFNSAVAQEKPAAILAFGLNGAADDLSWQFEKVGKNYRLNENKWIDVTSLDYGHPFLALPYFQNRRFYNDGDASKTTNIPASFWDQATNGEVYQSLYSACLDVKANEGAGDFLCDFMTYSVANQIGADTKYAGFVHVGQQVTATKGSEGVQIMLDGIVKELNK